MWIPFVVIICCIPDHHSLSRMQLDEDSLFLCMLNAISYRLSCCVVFADSDIIANRSDSEYREVQCSAVQRTTF